MQMTLEIRNGDRAAMEHAGCERRVNRSVLKRSGEVLHSAGAAGRDQRHRANLADLPELLDIVPMPRTVGCHAVEHDFPGAALLHFTHPAECIATTVARA